MDLRKEAKEAAYEVDRVLPTGKFVGSDRRDKFVDAAAEVFERRVEFLEARIGMAREWLQLHSGMSERQMAAFLPILDVNNGD